uniref:P2Y purinoceptor 2-like n=1 Tax=Labrus bergylta TaxID=56723 RepID=A0A3Q3E617_9LABR|nr:P2Y purinoceptor 2-like [Labrus bergylta]
MSSSSGVPLNISTSVLNKLFDAFPPSPSTFPPSPSCSIDESYKYIFLPICYSFTFIFSISLNSVILYRSFRRTKRWNASLIYMVNLASTDFMYGLSLPFLVARFAQTGHVTRLAGLNGNGSTTVNLSHEVLSMNGSTSNGNLGVVIEEYQNCWDDAIDKEFPDYVPYGIILHLLGFFVPFSIIAWCYSHVVLTIFRSLHIQPSSSRGSRAGGHEGIHRHFRRSPKIDGGERRGSNGMSRTRIRDEGVSIFLGANSPYANRRRKSIKTIITITLLFALCFFPFHVTRTIFLLLKVTNRVPCHTMTMVSMCYKITRPLASFNAWLNALLYFLTKDKGGAHCCQMVNTTNHQHGGLLLPLRMMGKGKDADEGGMEDGINNEENKAFHNSPPYMNRAKVRFIVE